MRFLILFLVSILVSTTVWGDEITHQFGNSGYAIREAMQEGAAQKSPEHYWNAVKLQGEGRKKWSKRYLKEAMELSRQAEAEAKVAIEESH